MLFVSFQGLESGFNLVGIIYIAIGVDICLFLPFLNTDFAIVLLDTVLLCGLSKATD